MNPQRRRTTRRLERHDQAALETFSCQDIRQPWTVRIEYMIRWHLADNIEREYVDGLGLWLDDQLSGIIAWQLDDDEPAYIRSSVLAVRYGARRQGIALQLKNELLEIAVDAGVAAIVSTVHWDNDPMRALNEQLGANVYPIAGDND